MVVDALTDDFSDRLQLGAGVSEGIQSNNMSAFQLGSGKSE